jgi:hypothetical protein
MSSQTASFRVTPERKEATAAREKQKRPNTVQPLVEIKDLAKSEQLGPNTRLAPSYYFDFAFFFFFFFVAMTVFLDVRG